MATFLEAERRAAMLRDERATLLASSDFVRSPVMSQLLDYLVHEAIANPGSPPKAYQVAVDGLGRTEDFDVQTDSYPRVQVGRLRKMLTAHYAALGQPERLRIPIGHYAVEIDMDEAPSHADDVPGDSEDSHDMTPEPGAHISADIDDDDPAASRGDRALFSNWQRILGLAAFFAVLAFGLMWLLDSDFQDPLRFSKSDHSHKLPPIMYISSVQRDGFTVSRDAVLMVDNFFEDAFASSSQVRLAALGRSEDGFELDPDSYQFRSKLFEGPNGLQLSFSVIAMARSETIWSTTMPMPESPSAFAEQLGPVVSRVASRFGAIPSDQRKHLPDDEMLGYACLLRYNAFHASREKAMAPAVEACLEKSLEADAFDSQILAAASYMAFLREEATGKPPDSEAGLDYARRAMVRGREKATANFALARSSFFMGNCVRGKEFAERAIALEPYEPMMLAETGACLSRCKDPDGTEYLQRAIALDPRGSIVAQTALVLTLLADGKNEEALDFAEKIIPSSTSVGPYYDIAMALAYSKNGRPAEARASWGRLVRAYGNDQDENPRKMLQRLVTDPSLAQQTHKQLVESGVISS